MGRILKSGEEHYWAIHAWLRKYPKSGICVDCKGERKTDWANISGEYLRDIVDYKELCRSCHNVFDGRAKLTEDEVRQIRAEYIPRKMGFIRLGNKYGVSRVTVENIIKGKKWARIK